jgi:hypothetical protein
MALNLRRSLTFRKSRWKARTKRTVASASELFHSVKLGGEIDMGQVDVLAHALVSAGDSAVSLAREASELDMAQGTIYDLKRWMITINTCSVSLRKVSEAYFGPLTQLPVWKLPEEP